MLTGHVRYASGVEGSQGAETHKTGNYNTVGNISLVHGTRFYHCFRESTHMLPNAKTQQMPTLLLELTCSFMVSRTGSTSVKISIKLFAMELPTK